MRRLFTKLKLPILGTLCAIAVGLIFALGSLSATAEPAATTVGASSESYLPLILDQLTPTPFPTPILPSTMAEALVQITPNGPINASTFNPNSIVIYSPKTHDLRLLKVTFDLSTAILPDMVFDPDGLAGDSLAGDVKEDRPGGVGYSGRTLSGERGGGYDVLEMRFNTFLPGRLFEFSVDVDPNSIRGVGAPGPAESGSVSGLELMGATISAEFENGIIITQQLYHIDGTGGGAEAILRQGLPARPILSLVGQPTTPTTVATRQQNIEVSGPAHHPVRLFQAEAGLFLNGVPLGGFNIEPYDANNLLWFTSYEATIGPNGTVIIPVNLQRSNTEGGLNHFVAVFDNFYGTHGRTSTPLVVEFAE